MKNKLFNYGITIGLIISLIGFILLKTDLLNENYTNLIDNIYKLTFIISIIFILTKSLFIKEKFNQILKTFGFIFFSILIMNLIKEFSLYEIAPLRINVLKIAPYILISILLSMYTYHFIKKIYKNQLDYLKIGLVILFALHFFLNQFNLFTINIKYIFRGVFWSLIIGMLYLNYKKENSNKTLVE